MKVSLDFETRSTVDLRKTGVYPYALHPDTDVWCMAWAIDDEDVQLWLPGDPFPEEIGDQLRDLEFHGWNVAFERIIWWLNLTPRAGWPRPELEQFFDTAAVAAAHALPRKLSNAAKVLRLPEQIAEDKHGLIQRMAKPRRPRKGEHAGIYWWDDEDRRQQLYEACKQDVRAERAIGRVLRPLHPIERQVYLMDQRMNDRGVKIDLPLVEAAQGLVDEALERANGELEELTCGEVTAVTLTKQLTEWLQAAGAPLDNLQKSTIRDLLDGDEIDELDDTVRRVVELRQETAKSSTSKLAAMMNHACADARARGQMLYHGAGTGRWSGRGIQPQNFVRPDIKGVERFIELVMAGAFEEVEAEYPVLRVIASLLRSMLIAEDGYRFLAGDFAQIEARVLAWLAGQDDLVRLFAEEGQVYHEQAAYIQTRKQGRLVTAGEIVKGTEEYQLGKNSVLGCGYQMGPETFQRQAREQQGAEISDEDAALAVTGYRERYPRIPLLWDELNTAAMSAVRNPGRVYSAGRNGCVKYTCRGWFLWCRLPSGRFLAYPLPEITSRKTKWGSVKESVTYWTTEKGRWWKVHGYGGKWTENVVQAIARDLMALAMLRLEEAGYRPVLTVHDEVVCEEPNGQGSLEEFIGLMMTRPRWAAGLPIAAEGWEGTRYRK